MTAAETFLREFHVRRPHVTSRAFARGGSYQRLAARVPPDGRVLDLACGDRTLVDLIGARATGLDLASGPVIGRAQELPFRDGAFAAVTCHLAFMLFDDIERVVGELARVLAPGGVFLALLGGGPTADGDDAFHVFASHVLRDRRLGDRRASTEEGWRQLFAGWQPSVFERWELDLSGSLDEVWSFLSSSYQTVDAAVRDEIAARFPAPRVPCKVATYLATVTR